MIYVVKNNEGLYYAGYERDYSTRVLLHPNVWEKNIEDAYLFKSFEAAEDIVQHSVEECAVVMVTIKEVTIDPSSLDPGPYSW